MSEQIIEPNKESSILNMFENISSSPKGTGDIELDKAIEIAGYSYDRVQDIFYSNMNPWQRDVGYCRLYDEASAPLGMIIDSEPIHFEYIDKKWMIGFWKGQYDLVTGAEIGVYTEAFDVNILKVFSGTFYKCANNSDLLQMSFVLKKNGKILFAREDRHWWLTGFKLGEFSEPSELTLDIKITLSNVLMRDAFVLGLWNAGYSLDEFSKNGNTVSFTLAKPHSEQPITRINSTDRIIQKKNKILCEKYQDLTKSSDNIPGKVNAVKELAPELYNKILRLGKSNHEFELLAQWLTGFAQAQTNK